MTRKHRTFAVFFLFFILFAFPPLHSSTQSSAAPGRKDSPDSKRELKARKNLQNSLRRIHRSKHAQTGSFGIHVKLLDGPVIFARNSIRRFHPASCMKLLTAAAVLRKLTPKFRFQTVLAGSIEGDTLTTPLFLQGRGDPSLRHQDLSEMIQTLSEKGVKNIPKGIVIDDYYFDSQRFPPGFGRPSSAAYIAPTGALSINRNTVTVEISPADNNGCRGEVRVTPPSDHLIVSSAVKCHEKRNRLTVAANNKDGALHVITRGLINSSSSQVGVRRRVLRPCMYAGQTMRRLLQSRGITVGESVKRGRMPENVDILAKHESEPLQELITHMNMFSDNHYAEQLLKVVGAETAGAPGTTKKGLEVVSRLLDRSGVKRNAYVLANGSGLFADTAITPRDIVMFLQRVSTLDWLQENLIESLPIAGRNGTLASRFKGSRAEGRVRAKTGTLRDVSTLSGYVLDRKNRPVVIFAILHNDLKGSHAPYRAIQDEVAEAITAYVDQWR